MNTLQRLLLLPPELCLDTWQLDEAATRLCLTVVSVQVRSDCPLCKTASSRVHSHYERTLADLPCGGSAVTWKLRVRKFFCKQPECDRRVFTERLSAVVAPWARRTARLAERLAAIALALGGAAGAKLSSHLGLPLSHDTLLRSAHRLPLPELPTPRVLGIDDWAHRKGCTYGTILVDLEARRPVALLADRKAETVAAWLVAHPGVEVISRDRSVTYRQAATEGAPQAVQVADRFHLLHNLAEVLQRVFDTHIPILRAARPPTSLPLTLAEVPPPEPLPRDIERSEQIRSRRMAAYEAVYRLSEQGCPQKEIAQGLGLGERTVRRYLSCSTFPERGYTGRGKSRSGLDEHKAYLLERWNSGCRNGKLLLEELCQRGFQGSYATVSSFLRCLKQAEQRAVTTATKGHSPVPPLPPARDAVWLVMRPPAKRNNQEGEQLDSLRQSRPEVLEAIVLAEEFCALVREGKPDWLDPWLERAGASRLQPFVRFAGGLREDLEAVRAGVALPWSNGQVEGQVNRLKMLKRQMYGRAAMDLLRRRFLMQATAAV